MKANKFKTVLVTGGAKRLGAEICKVFLADGWQIACHYKDSATEAEAFKSHNMPSQNHVNVGLVETFKADLADSAGLEHLFDAVVAHFGRLDCIINCASLFEPDEGISFTDEVYLKQHAVNVLAPIRLTQLLASHCKLNQKIGVAVQILDQKVDNLNPDYFSYTLSKLALKDSIKLQAQALAPNVRVLGVSPGLMYLSGPQTQENFDKASKVNLLKTPIEPRLVAKACLDLVSNPAINGAIVNVDNGQHLVPLGRDVMFLVDTL